MRSLWVDPNQRLLEATIAALGLDADYRKRGSLRSAMEETMAFHCTELAVELLPEGHSEYGDLFDPKRQVAYVSR